MKSNNQVKNFKNSVVAPKSWKIEKFLMVIICNAVIISAEKMSVLSTKFFCSIDVGPIWVDVSFLKGTKRFFLGSYKGS